MTTRLKAAALAAIISLFPASYALADFQQIAEKDDFLDAVSDRDLTRLGVRLTVTPGGDIRGRAFGRDVTGNWRWEGNYFCRELYFGSDPLEPNCQLVARNGDTLRFVSDRGQGRSADLNLD